MAYKPPKQTIADNDLKNSPSNEAVFEALKLKVDEPTVNGAAGQLLQLDGYVLGEAITSWVNPPTALPSQTGNLDKVLYTNGTTAEWQYTGLGTASSYPASSLILGRSKPTSLTGTVNHIIGTGTTGDALSSGVINLIIGHDTAPTFSSGVRATAIGHDINIGTNTFGPTAVGNQSSVSTSGGVAVGWSTVCNGSVALGSAARSESNSISIGYTAGQNSTSTNSINIGVNSGTGASSNNVVNVGNSTYSATDGIAVGDGTISRGARSISIGKSAASGSGVDNVVIGTSAGRDASTGANNVIIGSSSGTALTSGEKNLIIGPGSGVGIVSGSRNIILGQNSANDYNTTDNIVIGVGSRSFGDGSISIGNNIQTVNGGAHVLLGKSTQSFCYSTGISIGSLAKCTTGYIGMAIGYDASSTANGSIVIGHLGHDNGISNSLCFGGKYLGPEEYNNHSVDTGYFGQGANPVTSAANATPFKLMVGIASGSNVDMSAGSLTLAGSRGTGTGPGGDVIISTAPAGSSGSTLNAHVERMRVTADGKVGIGTNSPSVLLTVSGDSSLDGALVVNEAGANKDTRIEGEDDVNLIFVDASEDKVGIGTNTPSEKLEVNGNIKGGTLSFNADANRQATVTNLGFLTNTKTHDFGSLSHGAEEETTITVTGASVGDACFVGAPAAVDLGLSWDAYVSAADTVTLRVYNYQNSGSIDPASATWRVTVLKT